MARTYSALEVEPESRRAQVCELWQANLSPRSDAQLCHKLQSGYVDNPAGRGKIVIVYAGDAASPVGVQGIHPRRLHFGSHHIRAANLADYAVNSEHRTLGPALILLKHAIAISNASFELVYGIANRKSAAVCARAGLQKLGTVTRFAKLTSSRSRLAASMPAAAADLISPIIDCGLSLANLVRSYVFQPRMSCRVGNFDDASIDQVWRRRCGEMLLSERTAEMLRWRYADPIAATWQLCALAAHGNSVGQVVWRLTGTVAQVGDFFCVDPERMTASLLHAFSMHAFGLGAHSISLEFCGSAAVVAQIGRAGFRPRASEGSLFLRPGAPESLSVSDLSAWYFTHFDNDSD